METFRSQTPHQTPIMRYSPLVIGGSRGLGELTAKLLCSGGGCVHLTYSRGRNDARRVSAEIMAVKRGVCKPLELDILAPLSSDMEM